jgi:hypothetical protein
MGAGLTSGLTGISQEDLTIWSGPYVVILIWWYLGLTSPLQHGPHQFLEKKRCHRTCNITVGPHSRARLRSGTMLITYIQSSCTAATAALSVQVFCTDRTLQAGF